MYELIEAYARQAGIEGVDSRKLRVFAELVLEHHQSEMEVLKTELHYSKAQNEIYRNVVNDSY